MAAHNLAEAVNALTPEQQESVWQFLNFLTSRDQRRPSPFLSAVDDFIADHPELLKRLAQ